MKNVTLVVWNARHFSKWPCLTRPGPKPPPPFIPYAQFICSVPAQYIQTYQIPTKNTFSVHCTFSGYFVCVYVWVYFFLTKFHRNFTIQQTSFFCYQHFLSLFISPNVLRNLGSTKYYFKIKNPFILFWQIMEQECLRKVNGKSQ